MVHHERGPVDCLPPSFYFRSGVQLLLDFDSLRNQNQNRLNTQPTTITDSKEYINSKCASRESNPGQYRGRVL